MNENQHILDDSRKWEKPMELIFGKKFKVIYQLLKFSDGDGPNLCRVKSRVIYQL